MIGVFVPSLVSETFLATVRAAVVTVTPDGSVATRLPTLVDQDEVLWNVPLALPAFTQTTKVTLVWFVSVVDGNVQVTVFVPVTVEVGVAKLLIEDVAVAVVPLDGGAMETPGAVVYPLPPLTTVMAVTTPPEMVAVAVAPLPPPPLMVTRGALT